MATPNSRTKTQVLGTNITANQADPTLAVDGIRMPDNIRQVHWVVLKPALIATYTIRVWEWQEAVGADGEPLVLNGVTAAKWIEVDEVTGVTEDATYDQYTNGARVILQVDDIVNLVNIGDGFLVLYTGIDRP